MKKTGRYKGKSLANLKCLKKKKKERKKKILTVPGLEPRTIGSPSATLTIRLTETLKSRKKGGTYFSFE